MASKEKRKRNVFLLLMLFLGGAWYLITKPRKVVNVPGNTGVVPPFIEDIDFNDDLQNVIPPNNTGVPVVDEYHAADPVFDSAPPSGLNGTLDGGRDSAALGGEGAYIPGLGIIKGPVVYYDPGEAEPLPDPQYVAPPAYIDPGEVAANIPAIPSGPMGNGSGGPTIRDFHVDRDNADVNGFGSNF